MEDPNPSYKREFVMDFEDHPVRTIGYVAATAGAVIVAITMMI